MPLLVELELFEELLPREFLLEDFDNLDTEPLLMLLLGLLDCCANKRAPDGLLELVEVVH